MSWHGALEWLATLPHWALYAMLGVAAAVENVFPPVPADTIAAFGSFLAAREKASLGLAFLCVLVGNVASAMGMYSVGARLPPQRIDAWLARWGSADAIGRLREMHRRRGLVALFLSRFLPGVRAVVPPFAGALRVPALPVAGVITLASAIWYGAIMWIAYRLGASWSDVHQVVGAIGRWGTIAGLVVVGAAVAWMLLRARRRRDV